MNKATEENLEEFIPALLMKEGIKDIFKVGQEIEEKLDGDDLGILSEIYFYKAKALFLKEFNRLIEKEIDYKSKIDCLNNINKYLTIMECSINQLDLLGEDVQRLDNQLSKYRIRVYDHNSTNKIII